MMRVASLLLALSLLTLAATANAECAWVLWELGQVEPQTWRPMAAFSGERSRVEVRQALQGTSRMLGQLAAPHDWISR